jgi:hypothetical protein
MREEYKLKVPDDWVLKRIFGLKKEEVIGGWTKMRNSWFHCFFFSPNMVIK